MRTYLTIFGIIISLISGHAQSERVLFILDASGSMWQKMDDKFKKDIAADVLLEALGKVGGEVEFGLIAYGHNEKGDCDDIEVIFPISKYESDKVKSAIRNIEPKGKTPLARSAKMAVELIKRDNLATTIILITDGLETCDGDLCRVVQDAKNDNIDFKMHVVGFGLSEDDRTTLKCAAEKGNGLYLDANSENELSFAIERSTEMTTEKEPGILAVKCIRNTELVDCAINVYSPGLSNPIAGVRTYNSKETNPATFNLPLGRFDVKAEMVNQQGIKAQTIKDVDVTEDGNQMLQFDFSSGKISIEVTANGELHDAGIKVMIPGEKKSVALGRSYVGEKSNPWIEEVAPGTYDVEVRSIKIQGDEIAKVFEGVQIRGGKTTLLEHDYKYGSLSVGAMCGEELCDAIVHITSVKSGKIVDQGRTYAHAKSNPKQFILTPATYEVTVKPVKHKNNQPQTFLVELRNEDEISKQAKW